MSHLPLTALRAFEAVARTGSFTRAADELFVTQSAVSHAVRQLEDWLQTPLFDRNAGRPRLTPPARDLADSLTRSLTDIATACARLRAEERAEPLVIAAIPSVATCWLIPRLADFRARHPDIPLRIVYALHGRDFDPRDIDLAFVFSPEGPPQADVPATPFLPGDSVPVVAAARLAGRSGVSVADFAQLGLLHDTDRSGWRAWYGRAGCPMPDLPDAPVYEDFNLLRAAALAGQGVALCPQAMIRPDLRAGHLVQLSPITVGEGAGYYLLDPALARGGAQGAARGRVFRDWALSARDPA